MVPARHRVHESASHGAREANIDVIRAAESRKHSQIETGDMRYYQHRVISTAMLGHHKAADWEVMAAEIGACTARLSWTRT